MVKEPEIVVIDSAREDDYGNVFFTDKVGREHKVGKKRGDGILGLVLNNEGRAVKLVYKRFQQYDYIDDVELVSDAIKATPDAPPPQELEGAPQVKEPTASRSSGQEVGMFWKELGEWLRLKENDKGADPFWKSMRSAYFAKMFTVLDITIERGQTTE